MISIRIPNAKSRIPLHFQPFVANPRQARFAVAGYEDVDERREWLRILRARSAGNHQRMIHRPLCRANWNSTEVEHRQDVARTDFILQREAEDVEVAQRREGFEAVEREALLAKFRLHVEPRRERPLAGP